MARATSSRSVPSIPGRSSRFTSSLIARRRAALRQATVRRRRELPPATELQQAVRLRRRAGPPREATATSVRERPQLAAAPRGAGARRPEAVKMRRALRDLRAATRGAKMAPRKAVILPPLRMQKTKAAVRFRPRLRPRLRRGGGGSTRWYRSRPSPCGVGRRNLTARFALASEDHPFQHGLCRHLQCLRQGRARSLRGAVPPDQRRTPSWFSSPAHEGACAAFGCRRGLPLSTRYAPGSPRSASQSDPSGRLGPRSRVLRRSHADRLRCRNTKWKKKRAFVVMSIFPRKNIGHQVTVWVVHDKRLPRKRGPTKAAQRFQALLAGGQIVAVHDDAPSGLCLQTFVRGPAHRRPAKAEYRRLVQTRAARPVRYDSPFRREPARKPEALVSGRRRARKVVDQARLGS